MTAPDGPARREGTTEDIAGLRLYYRVDGVEQHIDWDSDRGPTIAEAMAVKAATVSKVTVGRMLEAIRRSTYAWEDPEALQGVVWLVRRRAGDTTPITALAGLDLASMREEYLDAQGAELDFPDPTPDPEVAQLAADLAADIMRHLPGMDHPSALLAAASLVRAAPAPEPPAGEDPAGDEPAAAAPPVKATPRKRAAARRTTPAT